MTSRIGNRLDIYGVSTCPACGNFRESVFSRTGTQTQLVCRNHPGHPLYQQGKHEAEQARTGGLPESTLLGVGTAS